MAKICLVTDSTSDIPKELAGKWGISVVPLKIHFGEEMFLDGVDLLPKAFFEKLIHSERMPTTSQPSPAEFERTYRELADVHGKEVQIISVHLSSALSGTYQSACLAKNMLQDLDITVIDSKKAAFFLGIIVLQGAKAAHNGASKEECVQIIQQVIQTQKEYFVLDTLTYLQKGGRIGKAQAVLGSLLNVKPILSLNSEGEVYPFDKVRGAKKAVSRMLEQLHTQMDGKEVVSTIIYAMNEEEAAHLKERIMEEFQIAEIYLVEAGPVIGAHVGPHVLAVSMYSTHNSECREG